MIKNFFIGPPRTMTSKFMHDLSRHPQVLTPDKKELKYFCTFYDQNSYLESHYNFEQEKPTSAYCAPLNCIMEYTRDRIFNYNPDAMIFIGLRNPIKRIISHHGIFFSDHMPKGRVRSFWDEMDENVRTFNRRKIISEQDYIPYLNNEYHSYMGTAYIECSMYYHMYQMWTKKFPEDHVGFVDFESAKTNYKFVFENICELMGVNTIPVDSIPIHAMSDHNLKIDEFDMEEMVDNFKFKYPEIHYQLKLEAIALSYILRVDYVKRWRL